MQILKRRDVKVNSLENYYKYDMFNERNQHNKWEQEHLKNQKRWENIENEYRKYNQDHNLNSRRKFYTDSKGETFEEYMNSKSNYKTTEERQWEKMNEAYQNRHNRTKENSNHNTKTEDFKSKQIRYFNSLFKNKKSAAYKHTSSIFFKGQFRS